MRRRVVGSALVGVAVVVVGLWAFQPWRLWTHHTVSEALPAAESSVLAEGRFVSQEHQTTGTARLITLADGSRIVRLEGFATSDGPDVHVWLTRTTGSRGRLISPVSPAW